MLELSINIEETVKGKTERAVLPLLYEADYDDSYHQREPECR